MCAGSLPVGAGAPGTGMKISPPRVLQLAPSGEKLGIALGVCAAAPARRLAARMAVPTPNNTEVNLVMVYFPFLPSRARLVAREYHCDRFRITGIPRFRNPASLLPAYGSRKGRN